MAGFDRLRSIGLVQFRFRKAQDLISQGMHLICFLLTASFAFEGASLGRSISFYFPLVLPISSSKMENCAYLRIDIKFRVPIQNGNLCKENGL